MVVTWKLEAEGIGTLEQYNNLEPWEVEEEIMAFYLSVVGWVIALSVVIKTAYVLSSKFAVDQIAAIFAFTGVVIAMSIFY